MTGEWSPFSWWGGAVTLVTMTTIATHLAAAGRFGRQADDQDALAQRLSGFAGRVSEHHAGPFLVPLEESQGRAVTALVSAAAALRSVAAQCRSRADEIREFQQSLARWELSYGDLSGTERPPAPRWHREWSMR